MYHNSSYHIGQQIANALGGEKGSWNEEEAKGRVHCPAHDDQNPSLNISYGEDGKLLWHCKAGCSQEAVKTALKEKGLLENAGPSPERAVKDYDGYRAYEGKMAALAEARAAHWWSYWQAQDDKKEPKSRKEQRKELKAKVKETREIGQRYLEARGLSIELPSNALVTPAEINHAEGIFRMPHLVWPIWQTVGHKRFSGVHITTLEPDGSDRDRGDYARIMRGVSKGGIVPIGRRVPDEVLCITEGVETALAVYQLTGQPTWAALSAPNMAAIQVPDAKAVEEVIVCADNDAAGLDAAYKLAERVAKSSKDRVVRVAVPKDEGDDWNDALPHADPADVLNAPVHTPRKSPSVSLRDFLKEEIPPRKSMMWPIIGQGESAMIFAWRGVGKTFFCQSLAFAMATGRNFLKWQSQGPVKVMYIDGEMDLEDMQERQKLLTGYFGLDPDSSLIDNFRFVSWLKQPDNQPMPQLNSKEGHAELQSWIDEDDPDIIFVDNLSALTEGEENEDTTWQLVRDFNLSMRRQGRATVLVHHSGKGGKERGSSKKEDALDLSLSLQWPEGYDSEQGANFDVLFKKARKLHGRHQRTINVQLETDQNGLQIHWEDKKGRTELTVADLYNSGMTQAEIVKQTGKAKSTISHALKMAKAKGLIS